MTFWIVVLAVMALLAVVWWTSGRAKPDLRRRSSQTEIDIRRGSTGGYDIRSDGGPGPGGF
jgi:hypothetical protein